MSITLEIHCSPRPPLLSYQRLLQTIGVLEAQRTQAILDLEALARHQKQALANPVAFVDQLQKQVRCHLSAHTYVSICEDLVIENQSKNTLHLVD